MEQLNPQHTVPTLEDNGNVFWDSHAIVTYLVDKYAPNDALYPKDLFTRARVDQRLHFDSGVLFARLAAASRFIYGGGYEVPQPIIDQIYEVYQLTETFLKDDPYLVGDALTVADLCAATTISALHNLHAPIDATKYPKLNAWCERIGSLPYYKHLESPLVQKFNEFMAQKKAANKSAADN